MTELKNCPVPWCGGEAFSLKDSLSWSGAVHCTKCGCTAPDAETWNTRADRRREKRSKSA